MKITVTKQEVRAIINTSLEKEKSKLHNIVIALGHIKNNKKTTAFYHDLQNLTQNKDIKQTLKTINNEVNQDKSLLYEEKMQAFADKALVELPKNSQETSDLDFKKEIQNFKEEIKNYLTFKSNIKEYYGDPDNQPTYFLHTLIHVYNGDFERNFIYDFFYFVKDIAVAIVNFVIAVLNTIVSLFTPPNKKPFIPYVPLKINTDQYRMDSLIKRNPYSGIVKNDIQLEIKRLKNLNVEEMTNNAQDTYTVTLRNDVKDKQAYLNNLRERFISDLLYIEPKRSIENLLSTIAKRRNIRFAESTEVKEFTTSAAELYMAIVDIKKDKNWKNNYQLINLYEKAAAENDIKAIKKLGDEAKAFSDNKEYNSTVDAIVDAICDKSKDEKSIKNLINKRSHKVASIENSIDKLYQDFNKRSKDERNRKSGPLLKEVRSSIKRVKTNHQPPNYKENSPKPVKSAMKKR